MKLAKRLFLLLSIIPLSGCSIKSSNAIADTQNLDYQSTSLVEIDTDTLKNMTDSKQSFSILFYVDNCSSCAKAKATLSEYVLDAHHLIYSLFVDYYILQTLIEYYPQLFTEQFPFPSMMIFKNGEFKYLFQSSKLTSLSSFKDAYETNIYDSCFSLSISQNSYEAFLKQNESIFVFGYDSSNIDTLNVYSQYLYPKYNQTKKKVLLVDNNLIDEPFIKNESFIYYNNEKTHECNYLTDISNFVNNIDLFFAD